MAERENNSRDSYRKDNGDRRGGSRRSGARRGGPGRGERRNVRRDECGSGERKFFERRGDRPSRFRDDRGDARRDERRDGFSRDRRERRDDSRGERRTGYRSERRDGSRDDRRGVQRDDRRSAPRRNDRDREHKRREDGQPRRFEGDRSTGRPRRSFEEREHRAPREQRGSRSHAPRGGRNRKKTEADLLHESLRPVRADHVDPEIFEGVTAKELPPSARNELKSLDKHLGELVGAHLAMAGLLIEQDPDLAHQHALSATRRAGRLPVARETLAMTAYRTGDYGMALRELRTYRRLTGRDDYIAVMIDSERGMGRPKKALEVAREVDLSTLKQEQRVHVAIALSGARLDLGQPEAALAELEIPELTPNTAYSWSAELFRAYAAVLEDLGQDAEADKWEHRAVIAENAWHDAFGGNELEVIELEEEPFDDEADGDKATADEPLEGETEADDATAAETDEA